MNITPIFTERELKFIRYALIALHGGLTYGDVNYKQREADLKHAKQLSGKIDECLRLARSNSHD